MSKLTKIVLACCLLLCLTVVGFVPAITKDNTALEKAAETDLGYTREEVKSALLNYERTGEAGAVVQSVLLPSSLGISTPNLNTDKVLNETPLKEYGNREEYYENLLAHGYDDSDMENLPYWQYEQLSANWLLDQSTRDLLASTYPELTDRDLSQWTIGMYRQFIEQSEEELLMACFTTEQQAALEERGISSADFGQLLLVYGQPETILAQSDETLKTVLEDWYQTKLTLTLGADWRVSARKT